MKNSKIKILIIDDDPSLRNMLTIVLKNEGYQVLAVESAITALNKLKKEFFDGKISNDDRARESLVQYNERYPISLEKIK